LPPTAWIGDPLRECIGKFGNLPTGKFPKLKQQRQSLCCFYYHIHYHVLVTDGVFSASQDGEAEFHPAIDLDDDGFLAVQMKIRKRGLR